MAFCMVAHLALALVGSTFFPCLSRALMSGGGRSESVDLQGAEIWFSGTRDTADSRDFSGESPLKTGLTNVRNTACIRNSLRQYMSISIIDLLIVLVVCIHEY